MLKLYGMASCFQAVLEQPSKPHLLLGMLDDAEGSTGTHRTDLYLSLRYDALPEQINCGEKTELIAHQLLQFGVACFH